MKVLFTCVGKSDPMTGFQGDKAICYDGSIMHICRYFKPDKVYFYMSKQIYDLHKKDNRYLKSIKLLNNYLDTHIEYEPIIREDLIDVHLFDNYYDDFEKCINDIVDEYGENTKILLNVSSGTPAMKSTLQTLSLLLDYNLIPIQVSDPTKGKDYRYIDINNYSVEEFWNNNIDNINDENRTYISQNDIFNLRIQKEIIINFIEKNNYEAAKILANKYRNRLSPKSQSLIMLSYYRYYLDLKKALNLDKEMNTHILPYKDDELFEYSLWLKNKYDNKEILDFLRGLNPFMYEACYKILKEKLELDIYDYCEYKKNNDTYHLLRKKLNNDSKGQRILKILDDYFKGNNISKYRDTYLTEQQMLPIIYKTTNNNELIDSLKKLDDIRTNMRNKVSHKICAFQKSDLKSKDTDLKINCLQEIKIILKYLDYDIDKYWKSYDHMNGIIVEELKKVK